jgi:hypothetical protein
MSRRRESVFDMFLVFPRWEAVGLGVVGEAA